MVGANPALNLNPREAGDRDVDVTVTGDEDATGALVANGAGGDDPIIGAPGAAVAGTVVAYGDSGSDVLSAPRAAPGARQLGEAELIGGAGATRSPVAAPRTS